MAFVRMSLSSCSICTRTESTSSQSTHRTRDQPGSTNTKRSFNIILEALDRGGIHIKYYEGAGPTPQTNSMNMKLQNIHEYEETAIKIYNLIPPDSCRVLVEVSLK